MIISRRILLRMINVSDKIVEKVKTLFMSDHFFFLRKSRRLSDNVEKCGRDWQAKDDNLAHTHCVPDNEGYKQTFEMCNAYCFSALRVVTRTRQCHVYTYIACLVIYLLSFTWIVQSVRSLGCYIVSAVNIAIWGLRRSDCWTKGYPEYRRISSIRCTNQHGVVPQKAAVILRRRVCAVFVWLSACTAWAGRCRHV
jgi:hypothetical protein